jgi:hypothetical protein
MRASDVARRLGTSRAYVGPAYFEHSQRNMYRY